MERKKSKKKQIVCICRCHGHGDNSKRAPHCGLCQNGRFLEEK